MEQTQYLAHYDSNDTRDSDSQYLAHYGVKGMHWGIRKDREHGLRSESAIVKKFQKHYKFGKRLTDDEISAVNRLTDATIGSNPGCDRDLRRTADAYVQNARLEQSIVDRYKRAFVKDRKQVEQAVDDYLYEAWAEDPNPERRVRDPKERKRAKENMDELVKVSLAYGGNEYWENNIKPVLNQGTLLYRDFLDTGDRLRDRMLRDNGLHADTGRLPDAVIAEQVREYLHNKYIGTEAGSEHAEYQYGTVSNRDIQRRDALRDRTLARMKSRK